MLMRAVDAPHSAQVWRGCVRMRVLTNESRDVTEPPSYRAEPPLTEQPIIRGAERKNMMFMK